MSMTLAGDLTPGPASVVLEQRERWIDGVAAADGLAIAHLQHRDQPAIESEIYTSTGVLVTRAAAAERTPRIAVGDGTLVVWEEDRGGGNVQPRSQVYASTLRGAPFAVAPSTQSQTQMDVASQGDAFLVVWTESGGGVFGRIVRNGEPAGEVIAFSSGDFASAPVVSSNGRDFVVAWIARHDFAYRIARVSIEGDVLDTITWKNVNWATGPSPFALACANGECLFAWRDTTTFQTCPRLLCIGVSHVLKAIRLGMQLEVLDATPLVLETNDEMHDIAIDAANDGSYAIAWAHLGRVTARVLGADGSLSAEITREGDHPALARQGSGWLLVREVEHELIGMRFDALAAGSDLTLFRDAQARLQPDVASDVPRVLLTYERTTRDEPAGGVPRAYVEAIDAPRPRRRAVR